MKSLIELQKDYRLAEVEHNRLNKELTKVLTQSPWEHHKIEKLRLKRSLAKMNADSIFDCILTYQLKIEFETVRS